MNILTDNNKKTNFDFLVKHSTYMMKWLQSCYCATESIVQLDMRNHFCRKKLSHFLKSFDLS